MYQQRRGGYTENACSRHSALEPDDVWVLDFVFDRTTSGSQLKLLSFVGEYTRKCLALKLGCGISREGVIETFSDHFVMRGVRRHTRCHNGPELVAYALRR